MGSASWAAFIKQDNEKLNSVYFSVPTALPEHIIDFLLVPSGTSCMFMNEQLENTMTCSALHQVHWAVFDL